jgi:hypothetical protein
MEQGFGLRVSGFGAAEPRMREVRVDGTPGGALARIGLTLAALVTTVAIICAAAMIWLCLTQPYNVADLIGRGEIWALFRAVAAFLVSAAERVVHYL